MGLFSKKDKAAEAAAEADKSALFGNRSKGTSPAPSANPYASPPPPYGAVPSAQNYTPHSGGSKPDPARDALFGGRQAGGGGGGGGGYGQPPSGYGQSPSGYGQPPADGSDDEEVDAIKDRIRWTKQESVSSSRNALRVAAQAEETGRNTLNRLGQQGERLYNTEKNLDLAAVHNRVAADKASELKTLNRSMFMPSMMSKNREKEEAKILKAHQDEKARREETRGGAYAARQEVQGALGRGGYGQGAGTRTQMSLAERSKYQFEADESDDEKETEINNNLDQLSAITGRLKGLAVATGQEVDRQNKQITKIMGKSDQVDDQIALTHGRIKKIH